MDKLDYKSGTDPEKDILNYILVKTISQYNQKNTIIKMEDLWWGFSEGKISYRILLIRNLVQQVANKYTKIYLQKLKIIFD